MHRISNLRAFLNRLGIRPKKSLSQNFLIDKNIIDKIIALSDVKPGDTVLEIGSGPGALTERFLEIDAEVIAVEKDSVFAKELTRFEGNLTVYNEDVLKVDFSQILKNKKNVKVVANLPYHITTPILTKLIPMFSLFSNFTLMVQDEVARRFTAKPNCKEYGSITVYLNYYSRVTYGFRISPNSFYPPPKIHSAVVRFDLKKPSDINEEFFFQMVRKTFEGRRKMIRTTLKNIFSQDLVTASLESIGCNPKARPENLSLEEWIALFRSLHDHSSSQEKADSKNC